MEKLITIVDAQAHHVEQIATIYNHALITRTATFETKQREASDVLQWLNLNEVFKVAIFDNEVAGFARSSSYRDRQCYAGIKEYSVYVSSNHLRKKVGETLLNALIVDCKANRIWKLLSRIFPENVPSIKLAQKVGFKIVGTYKNHAQLDGVWKDCTIVELSL